MAECANCGRPLTSTESIQAGVGPICGTRFSGFTVDRHDGRFWHANGLGLDRTPDGWLLINEDGTPVSETRLTDDEAARVIERVTAHDIPPARWKEHWEARKRLDREISEARAHREAAQKAEAPASGLTFADDFRENFPNPEHRTPQTITLGRTTYQVERDAQNPGLFYLTGPRGTKYGVMRTSDPNILAFALRAPKGTNGTRFRVVEGRLEPINPPRTPPARNAAPARAVSHSGPADPHDRDSVIRALRDDLQRRTGKPWSVSGGRGTSSGWIRIHAPPKRRGEFDTMTPDDQKELAAALGVAEHEVRQGYSIPASASYRRAAMQRAAGVPVTEQPTPYWD